MRKFEEKIKPVQEAILKIRNRLDNIVIISNDRNVAGTFSVGGNIFAGKNIIYFSNIIMSGTHYIQKSNYLHYLSSCRFLQYKKCIDLLIIDNIGTEDQLLAFSIFFRYMSNRSKIVLLDVDRSIYDIFDDTKKIESELFYKGNIGYINKNLKKATRIITDKMITITIECEEK